MGLNQTHNFFEVHCFPEDEVRSSLWWEEWGRGRSSENANWKRSLGGIWIWSSPGNAERAIKKALTGLGRWPNFYCTCVHSSSKHPCKSSQACRSISKEKRQQQLIARHPRSGWDNFFSHQNFPPSSSEDRKRNVESWPPSSFPHLPRTPFMKLHCGLASLVPSFFISAWLTTVFFSIFLCVVSRDSGSTPLPTVLPPERLQTPTTVHRTGVTNREGVYAKRLLWILPKAGLGGEPNVAMCSPWTWGRRKSEIALSLFPFFAGGRYRSHGDAKGESDRGERGTPKGLTEKTRYFASLWQDTGEKWEGKKKAGARPDNWSFLWNNYVFLQLLAFVLNWLQVSRQITKSAPKNPVSEIHLKILSALKRTFFQDLLKKTWFFYLKISSGGESTLHLHAEGEDFLLLSLLHLPPVKEGEMLYDEEKGGSSLTFLLILFVYERGGRRPSC